MAVGFKLPARAAFAAYPGGPEVAREGSTVAASGFVKTEWLLEIWPVVLSGMFVCVPPCAWAAASWHPCC